MNFDAAHPTLAAALAERGYTTATPVQAAILAPETRGRDLLASARTGSGKTIAFGLCLADALLGDAPTLGAAGAPLALVIAPTRELALQVRRELAWLWAPAGARVASCVGGMDARREARSLADGAHIVVGTPGRLRDHLERGVLRLGSVRVAVLDEADEMLDLGFREELEALLDATPAERRTLLFSATLPPEIESLARRYQRDALRIAATSADEPHADIEHRAVLVAPREREHAIVNLLRHVDAATALVFCATRDGVAHMHASLVERGFSAVALSGELSQAERGRALQSLRDGRARVLVATDVAARGLDLPALQLVIHADLPHDPQVLLHRSGRTGRAGRKGMSVLVVPVNRRRVADRLVWGARVEPRWSQPPSGDAVREKDRERITTELATLLAEPIEDDRDAAAALAGAHPAEALAAALIRLYRKEWPDPEELPETEALHARLGAPRGPRTEAVERRKPDVVRPEPALRVERPLRPVRPAPAPAQESVAVAREGEPAGEQPETPETVVPAEVREPPPAPREPTPVQSAPAPAPAPAPVTAPATAQPERGPGRTPVRKRDLRDPGAARARAPLPELEEEEGHLDGGGRTPRRREERAGRGAPEVHGVWFRVNVGRDQNADPRWLVPMLCRRGGVDSRDIGAIRVMDSETRFEIASDVAGRFAVASRRPDRREPWVRIAPMERW
jgi:ATP-dependent RNA helicase DeaD